MNIQDWFPLGFTGLISLLSKGLSRVSSSTTVRKHRFFSVQFSLWSDSHIHTWLLEETIALTIWTFVDKPMSLFFSTLSRCVMTFFPRSKCLLISWLQTISAVILEPKKIKSHCFHCFPIYLPWSDGTGCHDLSFFECWVLSQLFTFQKLTGCCKVSAGREIYSYKCLRSKRRRITNQYPNFKP